MKILSEIARISDRILVENRSSEISDRKLPISDSGRHMDFFSLFPMGKNDSIRNGLCCQNFDLVKFREIIPRNPCYGTFFSRNFESEFSKGSDPPAESKLESELWPNSDPSFGLDNFVRT